MTKGRQKLLNRAQKDKLSDAKISYLKGTDYPDYFYSEAYYLIKKWTDKELEECGYQLLEDLFNKNHSKNAFSRITVSLHWLSCEIRDIVKLNSLMSNDYSFNTYCDIWRSLNYSYEDIVKVFELVQKEACPEAYLDCIRLTDNKGKPILIDFMEKHKYAHYYSNQVEMMLNEDKTKEYMWFSNRYIPLYSKIRGCIRSGYSFEEAYKQDFNIAELNNKRFDNIFPNLNAILNNMKHEEKSSTYTTIIDKDDMLSKARKIAETIPNEFTMQIPSTIYECIIKKNTNSLNIKLIQYQSVHIKKYFSLDNKEVINVWAAHNSTKIIKEILIFYSGNQLSFYNSENKLIPLTLNYLMQFNKVMSLADVLMKDLIHNGSMIFKDFLRNPMCSDMRATPILINDCIGKQNLNQYFSKYKNGHYFNWNKGFYQQYYVIMKALDRVKEEDKSKIINCKNLISSYVYNFKSVESFLTSYYICNMVKHGEENINEITIQDYINMCKDSKQKININLCSMKKIEREHNLLISMIDIRKNSLKVPKNSVYKPLRKLLPKEFEWIKGKNRLIMEGKIQKHCVASYADKITKDKCAIYSVVYNGIRYTLEFVYDNNSNVYHLRQCQSKTSYIGCENFDLSVIDYIKSLSNRIR